MRWFAGILGLPVTFFDIGSTKAKQFGFTMRLKNGKKFTCLGDEPYNPVNYEYVKGSDWLLHEAFCLLAEAETFFVLFRFCIGEILFFVINFDIFK